MKSIISFRLLARLTTLAALSIAASACQTTTPAPSTTAATESLRLFCSASSRLRYSRLDTIQTREDIDAHNASYDALCGRPNS